MSDFGAIDFNVTNGGPPVEANPDSLANPFLASIPEADRPVVGNYINEWDKGVTKRFQEIHEQYKPYKELGEIDYLRKAVDFVNYIDQDPMAVYEYLKGTLAEMGYEMDDGGNGQQQYQQEDQQYQQGSQFEGIPEEFVNRFSSVEEQLASVINMIQGQQQEAQVEQENRQLDNLLQQMHTQYGDFDDSFIVSRFIAGDDPQAAMNAYSKLVEKISAAAPKSPPPSFFSGNGGGVPTGQVDPRNLSRADTKALVASMLQRAQEG